MIWNARTQNHLIITVSQVAFKGLWAFGHHQNGSIFEKYARKYFVDYLNIYERDVKNRCLKHR